MTEEEFEEGLKGFSARQRVAIHTMRGRKGLDHFHTLRDHDWHRYRGIGQRALNRLRVLGWSKPDFPDIAPGRHYALSSIFAQIEKTLHVDAWDESGMQELLRTQALRPGRLRHYSAEVHAAFLAYYKVPAPDPQYAMNYATAEKSDWKFDPLLGTRLDGNPFSRQPPMEYAPSFYRVNRRTAEQQGWRYHPRTGEPLKDYWARKESEAKVQASLDVFKGLLRAARRVVHNLPLERRPDWLPLIKQVIYDANLRQNAIDEFCSRTEWAAEGWKNQPHVKALFDLRTPPEFK